MPDTTVPAFLYDAYGRPARASGSLYEATTDTSGRYVRRPNMAADYSALLNHSKWLASLSDCRYLGKHGIVWSSIVQKWQYISAAHFAPVFTGSDYDWAEAAETALAEADRYANTRGPRFDFKRTFELGGRKWETDGAFFLLLTKTATGLPSFQVLEAHRIGQRTTDGIVERGSARSWTVAEDGTRRLTDTAYVGLHIQSGIITNDAGTEVAYRVLGSSASEDLDISARDLWHIAPADDFSEARPLPGIARGSLDLFDLNTARKAQLAQQILDSKLSLIETNASGRPDPVAEAIGSAPLRTAAGTPTEVVEDGMTRFIKSGYALTPHSANRPSTGWLNYDEKTLKAAIAAIGWRAEALDPGLMSTGAPTRALQDIINTTILSTWSLLRPWVRAARRYQIAVLIQAGRLPANDEWLMWDTPQPPEFTVDAGRTVQSDLDAVRAGADSIPNLQRRWGLNPTQTLRDQARWLKLRDRIAREEQVDPNHLGTLDQTPAPAAP